MNIAIILAGGVGSRLGADCPSGFGGTFPRRRIRHGRIPIGAR